MSSEDSKSDLFWKIIVKWDFQIKFQNLPKQERLMHGEAEDDIGSVVLSRMLTELVKALMRLVIFSYVGTSII